MLPGAAAVLFAVGFAVAQGPISEWNSFEKAVRDQTISRDSARQWVVSLWPRLESLCDVWPDDTVRTWHFPLKGHGPGDIGKGGFRPDIVYGSSPVKGYDFYDGNRHGGHPAYDIFVRDTNRDCRDDRTGLPVPVVAPVRMLVLSIDTGWQSDSTIRGGNYVWAMEPVLGLLLYFAHLDSVAATPGDTLQPGQTLGTVGRSGANAAARRSPTHLHMMALRVQGPVLIPLDFLDRLRRP